MRFGHVGIEVDDLFTMELFYRTALGLSLRYRYVSRNTPGLRTVLLGREGLEVELLERSPGAPRRGPGGRPDNHLSLSVEDVDGTARRIEALALPGVEVGPARDTGDGFREAVVRDPEGNVLELSARIRPAPVPPVRALVFDLDGTLVDSEPNYYLADRELLARRGIAFSEEDKRRYIGGGNLDMMADLRRRYGLEDTPEALADEKNAIYLRLAEADTPVFAPMRRLLELARAGNLPVAVATGTSPGVLGPVLRATGLAPSFEVVVSAEEVERGKPSPAIFLETARRLGVPPETCVVVEDSRHGVEAAVRAFMRCVAVPYLTEKPLHPAFALADVLFEEGMRQFDPDHVWAFVSSLR